ncbi:hypothetical protein PV797_10225 [Clostridiaceae bacterium M8S5]|nr:hypothetical protein PV797_10225 [Clostridiaceae bacterium M8S5]
MLLKKTELHVHVLQCLYTEDLFELAKNHYTEINWNRFDFLNKYESIFGVKLNPIEIFERAVRTGSLEEIEEVYCYKFRGEGNFDEFNIKSYFAICITGYYYDKENPEVVLKCITERHKREGLTYVEYRNGFGGSSEEWKSWHARFARFFKEACTDTFTAKYIVRLGDYSLLKEIIEENPDLIDTIVGVDFSGKEIAPENLENFYKEVSIDRNNDPDKTVDVVVHIGENFYDKSLESAIRWCHQSALYGAKRLAHCIALGIDPLIAISRCNEAHVYESVKERIAQIKYDIKYMEELKTYNVKINQTELLAELEILYTKEPNEKIYRNYNQQRLLDITNRQNYVLDELKRIGTIIEVCPTSNLCISGVKLIEQHPFLKLYNSRVNLVICTDDPGVFDSSLSDEVDFIIEQFHISPKELCKRLGDPYKFRLKENKFVNSNKRK